MIDIFAYEFMRNAFLAAFLVSVACGVVGVYVYVKRIVFISGGIAHSAFGGLGIGYFLGVNPVFAAMPFGILSAIAIGLISLNKKISEDSAIGMLWSLGMAIGAIFIFLTPGFAPDLFGYLFGNILTVPFSDIILMAVLDVIIIVSVIVFYKEFMYICFDPEFALIVGVPSKLFYLLLLCLVALSIVVLISMVGIVLVIALLTMPAMIAKQFTDKLNVMMFLSTICGLIAGILGLITSFYLNLPSGPTIVLLLALGFLIALIFKKLR